MKKSIVPGIFFLTLLFFSNQNLSAQLKLDEKIPQDPHVKTGKLSNGLTYYIRENNWPEKKLELRLVVNAGSVLEDDNQQGLAHFVEHMSFNGSKNFKKNDLVSYLQSIGVKFGADLNAYTAFNETVYMLHIPTEKKEYVDKGFQILEDWAGGVSFDSEEIDKERGVVLEESRMGKGASDRMQKKYFPKILEGSAYAQRLPIGKDEVLKNFKYDVLKKFYSDWYRPDLMAVIVTGDIDPQEAERLIHSHFDSLKNPRHERKRIEPDVPARKKSEGLVVTDPEATRFVLQIYYPSQKAKEQKTIGDYRESIIRNFFISMLNQRLYEFTQQSNAPFISGSSRIGELVRGYKNYTSYAFIGKAGLEPALNTLIQENERARKFGFTSSELELEKKKFLNNTERAYNERNKTESSDYADEYAYVFLEHEPSPGIENEFKLAKKVCDDITLQQINEYAAKTIPDISASKLVLLTGPEKADFKIPTGDELLLLANKAAEIVVAPYEEKEIAKNLLETKSTPGKIENVKEITELGITELSLSNGVKIFLKPTHFKNDEVVMNAIRQGGYYLYDPAKRFSAENASGITQKMGVSKFSPVDLRKILAGKSASATAYLGPVTDEFAGTSDSANIETMLQLVYLKCTQPRKDKSLFDASISQMQSSYQNIMSNPMAVFQDSVMKATYNKNPWAPKIPSPDDFSKIDLDDVIRIYKERFGDMNGFTFIFTGNLSIEKIKPLLCQYIASLPSTNKKAVFEDPGLRRNNGVITRKVFAGKESKSIISLSFHGEAPFSAEERLKILALEQVLNIKLTETLREEMSGVYSAQVSGDLVKIPYQSYNISFTIPCGPENVDNILKALFAEIQKIKDEGPQESDLNKVKETWRQQYKENIKDNFFWTSALKHAIENETPLSNILTFEKRVTELTTGNLKEAAVKYLDARNYTQVVLYPQQ